MSESKLGKYSETFRRDTADLVKMRDSIAEFLDQYQLGEGVIYKIKFCADEAAANIVEHGGEVEADKDFFKIEVFWNEDKIVIHLEDFCFAFDPTVVHEKSVQDVIKSGKRGGLGLMFIKRLVESMSYERRDNLNFLELIIDPKKQ